MLRWALRERRVEAESLAAGCERAVEVALAPERDAEAVVGGRDLRVEAERLAEGLDRRVEISLHVERVSEAPVGPGVAGVEADRLAKGGDGGVEVSLVPQSDPEIVVGRGSAGVEADGLSPDFDGRVDPPPAPERDAEMVVGARGRRPQGDGRREVLDGRLRAREAAAPHVEAAGVVAELEVDPEVTRVLLGRTRQQLGRRIPVAAVAQERAQQDERAGALHGGGGVERERAQAIPVADGRRLAQAVAPRVRVEGAGAGVEGAPVELRELPAPQPHPQVEMGGQLHPAVEALERGEVGQRGGVLPVGAPRVEVVAASERDLVESGQQVRLALRLRRAWSAAVAADSMPARNVSSSRRRAGSVPARFWARSAAERAPGQSSPDAWSRVASRTAASKAAVRSRSRFASTLPLASRPPPRSSTTERIAPATTAVWRRARRCSSTFTCSSTARTRAAWARRSAPDR